MPKLSLCLLLLLLTAPGLRAKERAPLPRAITNATYLLVTTYQGDIFNPDVSPQDRHAVVDVQEAIEKWGRYKLVYKRDQADLILVVRTGRAVEARGAAQTGTSTGSVTRTPPRGSEESLGGELGDPLDTLDVYLTTQAIGSTPLWRSRAKDGLKPPDMRLLAEFRSKVEAAAKKP